MAKRARFGHLLAIAFAIAAATPAQAGGDPDRGREIYYGRAGGVDAASACVRCHRPSGLGSFEGGVAATPIAGRHLFAPYDRDTARFFVGQRSDRVRPAYTDSALSEVLRTGIAPDGYRLHPAMPRVALDAQVVADLAGYLRQLDARAAPGVEPHVVHLATITTPDVEPSRRDAMLATLQAFVTVRNGQTRHEPQRAVVAARSREMVKDLKFRHWQLHHWALEGPAETWAAQIDAAYAAQPVFALVGGVGGARWDAVHAFCERERVPCLLPLVDAAPVAAQSFYSLYFHRGAALDAAVAADAFRAQGIVEVEIWSDADTRGRVAAVSAALVHGGVSVRRGAASAVSLLPATEHASRARHRGAGAVVAWLPGAREVGPEQLMIVAESAPDALIVSPLRTVVDDATLRRTRLWLAGRRIQTPHIEVAAAALQAATALGDSLVHIDFDFTREYALELLEHGLENMLAYGPYPRLAIAPDQREASKGSYVGRMEQGRWQWTWRTPSN